MPPPYRSPRPGLPESPPQTPPFLPESPGRRREAGAFWPRQTKLLGLLGEIAGGGQLLAGGGTVVGGGPDDAAARSTMVSSVAGSKGLDRWLPMPAS